MPLDLLVALAYLFVGGFALGVEYAQRRASRGEGDRLRRLIEQHDFEEAQRMLLAEREEDCRA